MQLEAQVKRLEEEALAKRLETRDIWCHGYRDDYEQYLDENSVMNGFKDENSCKIEYI